MLFIIGTLLTVLVVRIFVSDSRGLFIMFIFETLPHRKNSESNTAPKKSKYGVFSGPYFPVFELNTGKYGLEITSHLDAFHAV